MVEEAKLYGNFKHYMILILGNMDKEVGVCVVLDSMVDQVGRWGGTPVHPPSTAPALRGRVWVDVGRVLGMPAVRLMMQTF